MEEKNKQTKVNERPFNELFNDTTVVTNIKEVKEDGNSDQD